MPAHHNDSVEFERRDAQLHRSIERAELFASNPGIRIDSIAPQDLIQTMRIPMSDEVKRCPACKRIQFGPVFDESGNITNDLELDEFVSGVLERCDEIQRDRERVYACILACASIPHPERLPEVLKQCREALERIIAMDEIEVLTNSEDVATQALSLLDELVKP